MTASDPQLQTAEFTLPDAFAANGTLGYQLASFGKWHLTAGPGTQNRPNTVGGWPHFAGLLTGALPDYFNWTKTTNGVNTTVTTYATTETTNDVIAWISAQSRTSAVARGR
jgi:arylsulfatase A-like enzyme